jgi:hypothetical protein
MTSAMNSRPTPDAKAALPPRHSASQAMLDAQAAAETQARMGIPADDIGRWIDSWGTPDELPVPSPRKAP